MEGVRRVRSAVRIGVRLSVAALALDIVRTFRRVGLRHRANVVERHSRHEIDERRPTLDHVLITLLWSTRSGQKLLTSTRWLPRLLEFVSVQGGKAMATPGSRKRIEGFIAANDIDTSELDRDLADFSNLNEFFARPLRAGARPIAEAGDAQVVVSPSDGRVRCFRSIGRGDAVAVKGHRYDVGAMLGVRVDAAEEGVTVAHGANRFRAFHDRHAPTGFSIAVCRLTMADYHRVHSPVDGSWDTTAIRNLPGEYHSTAPAAVQSAIDVFGRNRRVAMLVDTEAFGEIAVVIVGAAMIASIEITTAPGAIAKGDEIGLFQHGGSTVIAIFGADQIEFDRDLIEQSELGNETLIRMGDSLGRLKLQP